MYDAWKKKVIQDTTRIYYIDLWVLNQNLSCYESETVSSFTLGSVCVRESVCERELCVCVRVCMRAWVKEVRVSDW